jgi:purine-nucleoside phosphorylase
MTPLDLAHKIAAYAPGIAPDTAIVLGSGLGGLADDVEDPAVIRYGELPGFPASGVSSHRGELIVGRLAGRDVAVLAGRAHYYEHGDVRAMAVPIATLAALGVKRLVLTNAAGSLRADVGPGTPMLITDHIAAAGTNPLIGESGDERFVSMVDAYSPTLCDIARRTAKKLKIRLAEGVYLWVSGPSFETPAEIRMFRVWGADAVGMSTVPEVILARRAGLEVLAISMITNLAAGMTGRALSHDETKAVAAEGAGRLRRLVTGILAESSAPIPVGGH